MDHGNLWESSLIKKWKRSGLDNLITKLLKKWCLSGGSGIPRTARRLIKPKFHYNAHFPETSPPYVSGKSATCHREFVDMDHVTGKSRASFGISNHRDMSRWFEKFPWQVGNKPVCFHRVYKKQRNRRRHGQINGVVTGLSRTCRGEVDIMECGL